MSEPPALSGSSLTTKELQQRWREAKGTQRAHKVLFDIPSSCVVEDACCKHVVRHQKVYQVAVMACGSFSTRHVIVERRYSDFSHFHQKLTEEFGEEVEDLALPCKHLAGPVGGRGLALQDYLNQAFAVRCVRHSPLVPDLLTGKELSRARASLRGGQFRAALEQLHTVLQIQEKLAPWQRPTQLVPVLAAIAVCHRDLGEPLEAVAAAHRALPVVRRWKMNDYLGGLLETLVDLSYGLQRPVAHLQEELMALRDRHAASWRSLKEVVVRDVT
ncbi:sorting nexin-20 isoform X1 [Nerophis ophidion]|uniref:sorting nexin-20 isoform X1 n=1 Tax=Nerophis ophidion TaxID=159077 RepID=UPI002ADFB646|nr:sorting nexin-20 isoform X1 [Nerophis ophidion]